MAKATKLPSGQWRVNAYSHTDAGGKQHRVSFTAATKAEAEMKAAEFAATKKRKTRSDITVGEAIDGYIRAKEAVLSPSTVRGYLKMRRNNFGDIENKRIQALTTEEVQLFVSHLSERLDAKTVKNVYGLMRPAIEMYAPDVSFRVTLPSCKKVRPASPSNEDVARLIRSASPRMKIRIALAACGLRRGEICALKYEDVKNGYIHVHADLVQDKDNNWVYKEMPKTSDSVRFLKIPKEVEDMIGTGEGFIVNCKPSAVTSGFIRLRNKLGVESRLHDMRHFFASTAAVLGIPDVYLADMGGWGANSKVMKEVYQNKIRSMSDYYSEKMNEHLGAIMREDA